MLWPKKVTRRLTSFSPGRRKGELKSYSPVYTITYTDIISRSEEGEIIFPFNLPLARSVNNSIQIQTNTAPDSIKSFIAFFFNRAQNTMKVQK